LESELLFDGVVQHRMTRRRNGPAFRREKSPDRGGRGAADQFQSNSPSSPVSSTTRRSGLFNWRVMSSCERLPCRVRCWPPPGRDSKVP
jgi:hypothetical protein